MSLDEGTNRHKPCVAPGCAKEALVNGRCRTHNQRYRRSMTSDGVRGGPGREKMTAEDIAEARRMLVGFASKHAVAKHFGLSPTTLRVALSKDYVPAPSTNEVAS